MNWKQFGTSIFLLLISLAGFSFARQKEMVMSDPIQEFHRLYALLQDGEVAEDLDLTDKQLSGLSKTMEGILERSRHLVQRRHKVITGEASEEEKKSLQQDYQSQLSEVRDFLSSNLLPHQLERLSQINRQFNELQTMSGTGFGVLELSSELKLTDEQKRKLTDIQQQNEEEYLELLAKVRTEVLNSRGTFRSRLLEVLDREQLATYEKLVGRELFRSLSLVPILQSKKFLKRVRD